MQLKINNFENYYIKNIFYANYVKEIIMPIDVVTKNLRNKFGKKNIGNDKKLIISGIRSKSNFIRKTYHNFSDCKKLTFLTLTYALNVNNVKKCKKDLARFFKKIKYWNSKTTKKQLKYVYTYEYQSRGAVHFHIIINTYIPNKIILKNWKHGINKNLRVRENTQENVAKYCSKYITANYISKNTTNLNSLNQFDLNIKSYQFSYNCENPRIQKWVSKMTFQQIIAKAQKAEFIKFIKKAKEVENQKINVIFGANYDFKLKNYTNNYKKMIN